MDVLQFEQLVRDAMESLPAKLRNAVRNAVIVIEEEARSPSLLGLYEGVPLNVWGRESASGIPPDKITIYKRNIEREARGSQQRLRELVKEVVWHEIGHHFGFDEKQMREIEERRRG